MKISEQRIINLISRLRSGLTVEEQAELDSWMNASQQNRAFAEKFLDEEYLAERLKQRAEIDVEQGINSFYEKTGLQRKQVAPIYKRPVWRLAAAAAVIGIVAVAAYFFQQDTHTTLTPETLAVSKDIMPGSDKAVLILGDNSKIVLDNKSAGMLAEQGDIEVVKKEDGSIVYNTSQDGAAAGKTEMVFNSLITPRGGQYKLVLPDGSKVWLNAASSIKYPAYFIGKERTVQITGEAYFEVAKNPMMPFKVRFGEAVVEVLGTHFNINTYGDEHVSSTTLLEGSVRITNASTASPVSQSVVLKPGQQASLNTSDKITVNNNIDLDEVMAWKEGYFNFDNVDLRTIMNHISRWYDRDIVYETADDHRFSFRLPRNVPVSKLLNILEKTGAVKFSIDDKQIKVIK